MLIKQKICIFFLAILVCSWYFDHAFLRQNCPLKRESLDGIEDKVKMDCEILIVNN